ncbi:hypothetical protein [Vulcanisaeta thermophila]|uniref:hypothetical protein n=1 Tax=Vulcanisaeta thermophila TaxID=867917 RepID=UPI00085393EC|nr:hypothetical protein [Vulcanisaeta thermophila]
MKPMGNSMRGRPWRRARLYFMAWFKLGRGIILLILYAAAMVMLWLIFINPLMVAHYGSTIPLVAGVNLYFFSLLFMVGYLAAPVEGWG